MKLGDYYKLRSGAQANTQPADEAALAAREAELRTALAGSGLFHSVEVGRSEDRDRLLMAMVSFASGVDPEDVADGLELLWCNHAARHFWAIHHVLIEDGQVELQGVALQGPDGPFVTLHLVAQPGVPAQRTPGHEAATTPRAVAGPEAPAGPETQAALAMPQPRLRWLFRRARQLAAPGAAPA